MTTAFRSEPALPDLSRWAAATLDLGPESTPAEVRAQLLRRLEQEDFVPPLPWQQALLIYQRSGQAAGLGALVPEQALAEEEARLRTEVETLAAEFFTLPVADRRRRLADLLNRCSYLPPLTARLRELQAGLLIDVAVFQDANFRVNWLARYVCDLLVCRPSERASRRQTLVQSMSEEKMTLWQTAARHLQKRYRTVAALETQWIDELATWSKRQRRLSRARHRQLTRSAAPTRDPSPRNWTVVVVIGIVIGLIRMAANTRHSDTPSRPLPVPTMPRMDDWRKYLPDRTEPPNEKRWFSPPVPPSKPTTAPRKPEPLPPGKTP